MSRSGRFESHQVTLGSTGNKYVRYRLLVTKLQDLKFHRTIRRKTPLVITYMRYSVNNNNYEYNKHSFEFVSLQEVVEQIQETVELFTVSTLYLGLSV